MRLTRLKIDNFRGIASMEVTLERDVTVLIGENNSGKTSVLDAIKFGLEAIKSNKSCIFSEFDFHRRSPEASLSDCPEIVFTFFFEESSETPWSSDVIATLNPVIVGDLNSSIRLRMKGWFDEDQQAPCQDWTFLDNSDNEMGKKESLKDIRRLRPFFSQSALRVAKDEFQSGTYWNSFVKYSSIDTSTRLTLEAELTSVNQKIIDTHKSFEDITSEVKRISELVSVGMGDVVTIDPAKSDIYRSLKNAEVNLLTGTSAKIPVRSHGEGTQSLSVLLLFSAYLKTRLLADFDRLAEPIVAIEEPEAHLHPNAIRGLWRVLKNLPGQKIIATHSGDILSEVPVQALRRLNKESGTTTCCFISPTVLNPEESRKFNHHVRRNRGELLFARTWLLVEGETDVSVFAECAEIMGVNFNQQGIRVVECAQAGGPGIFIKAADALGVKWHVVADNDEGGQKYIKSAKSLLGSRLESDYISKLKSLNLDILLCINGYGRPYLNGLTPDNKLEITEPDDKEAYWVHVYKIIKNNRGFSKPAAAIESIELIRAKGASAVPDEIATIIEKLVKQSRGE